MRLKSTVGFWIFLMGSIALLLVFGGIVVTSPHEPTYRFIGLDHPINLWESRSNRWAYYMVPSGTVSEAADQARKELIPLGFKEDLSQEPWIRFLKDGQEVVLCRHDSFAVGVDGIPRHQDPTPPPPDLTVIPAPYPCILVKNGPGTGGSVFAFRLKKLVHGW